MILQVKRSTLVSNILKLGDFYINLDSGIYWQIWVHVFSSGISLSCVAPGLSDRVRSFTMPLFLLFLIISKSTGLWYLSSNLLCCFPKAVPSSSYLYHLFYLLWPFDFESMGQFFSLLSCVWYFKSVKFAFAFHFINMHYIILFLSRVNLVLRFQTQKDSDLSDQCLQIKSLTGYERNIFR